MEIGIEIREPEPTETDRIREVVDSSMTTSFRLSPQEIDAISTYEFSDDALEAALEDDDAVLEVAEIDDEGDDDSERTVGGVVLGSVDDDWGAMDWLFVDPEHRGEGIGTELFETARTELREQGAEHVRVRVLEKNTEGHEFAERFGFERAGEGPVEISDVSLAQYVYVPEAVDGDVDLDLDEESEPEHTDDLPETETVDGLVTAETDEGERVYVTKDDELSGTQAAFYRVFEDDDYEEQYGYYCNNCGSLDVAMDEMDRIECGDCGNYHTSKSGKTYDDSFL